MRVNTLSEFFSTLNDINFLYCVMRNWENLPDSVELGEHSDLDLLVYDFTHFTEVFPEATQEYEYPRVRFKMPIGDSYIYIDVRHVGDRYYPKDFEIDMLNLRIWNDKGFYTPDKARFIMGLAYHAVHHKNSNNYQKYLGDAEIKDLLVALKKSKIGYVEPIDPSVGRFNQYFSGDTAKIERKDGKIIKNQNSYNDYSLIENEERILSLLDSEHFPKVLEKTDNGLILDDCGEHLTNRNIPDNWKKQLLEIVTELREKNVCHNDIKVDNLLVKDGVLKLIDFGWGSLIGEDVSSYPKCLGGENRSPYGLDDNYSFKKLIKQIEGLRGDYDGI